MKRLLAIFLAICMCMSFWGCGDSAEKQPEEKPTIVGRWEYAAMDAAYVFHADGTGAYVYFGVEMPFTYTDDGKAVTIQFESSDFPETHNYTIKGIKLTIDDSFGEPVEYLRGDYTPPAATEPVLQAADPSWWEGSWYGWWCIRNGTGSFLSATNVAWDAYAQITLGEDNTASMTLWDTGTEKDAPLISAQNITFTPGEASVGCMQSAQVSFFPQGIWNNGNAVATMVSDSGWLVDPVNSTVSHFADMLEITGHYQSPENSEDSFDYCIYLRHWGAKWEDVAQGDTSGCIFSDMMPLYYNDWYLPLLEQYYTEPPASFAAGIAILENN